MMSEYRQTLNAMMAKYMRFAMMHGLDPRDLDTEFGRMYTSLFMEHQRLRRGETDENQSLPERAEALLQKLEQEEI